MSVQTHSRHQSSSQEEEEEDEKFIKESTELAKSFTELFISTLTDTNTTTGKSPLVSHEDKPASKVALAASGGGAMLFGTEVNAMAMANTVTIMSDPRSNAVAASLDRVAKEIDNNILNRKYIDSQTKVIEKRGRTIWDIGYQDFRVIMHGVFSSLDESVLQRSSGWEMAALVYRGVAGLIRDLRQQSGGQRDGSRAREGILQGFVGNFLEEIGLMTWITVQGGLDQWGSQHGERYEIPPIDITGTPV